MWLWCALLLTACGTPTRATPVPTPTLIRIAITPALRPLTAVISSCVAAYPQVALTLDEISTIELDAQSADLILRMGGAPGKGFTAGIGEQSIVVIVNLENPVISITTVDLLNLYTGMTTYWDEIGGKEQPIQVWDYPEGEDIRLILDGALFPGKRLTPQALIAPDPQAMISAIANDPAAIGFVPQTWLSQSPGMVRIRPVNIDPLLAELLHQPVFAESKFEPQGWVRQLLGCMQAAGQ
jgi:phosphate transport system substrate-binding protein